MNADYRHLLDEWAQRVSQAAASATPLCLRGGGSKDFLGRRAEGEPFELAAHCGVIAYEPSELVVSVRGGTRLAELEALLAERGQWLPFEPPHFGSSATVGGSLAAGLSGPGRARAGALRDYVLGVKLLDGRGKLLNFGGQVMKNVAGYDVSRLLAGSLGTLGIILEVSLKVLPRPPAETTLVFEVDEAQAIDQLCGWAGQPLPLSASYWEDGVLRLRLAGAHAAVEAARQRLGGEMVDPLAAATLWEAVREQQVPFFRAGSTPLWRLSLPAGAPLHALEGARSLEWGGAQRWLRSELPAAEIRAAAAALGGHAHLFRGGDRGSEVFHPLPAPLLALHQRLKASFDPAGIFNPGRLYQGL